MARKRKKKVLDGLTPQESQAVLRLLLRRHPALVEEAEGIAVEVASSVDRESVVADVVAVVRLGDMADLNGRAGRQSWDYVLLSHADHRPPRVKPGTPPRVPLGGVGGERWQTRARLDARTRSRRKPRRCAWLARELGIRPAARELGIPNGAVFRWLKRAGETEPVALADPPAEPSPKRRYLQQTTRNGVLLGPRPGDDTSREPVKRFAAGEEWLPVVGCM